jgi:multidrug efflux pump subunit AcrB
VLAAAAFAEHGVHDTQHVSNYVDRFVRDEIKRVPGVGDVVMFGTGRFAMRIWLDPDKPSAALTADDVVASCASRTQVAAGQVGSAPARPADLSAQRAIGWPPERAVRIRERHPEAIGDGAGARLRTSPASISAARAMRPRRAISAMPRDSACSSCRPPTRCRSTATSPPRSRGCRRGFRPG